MLRVGGGEVGKGGHQSAQRKGLYSAVVSKSWLSLAAFRATKYKKN